MNKLVLAVAAVALLGCHPPSWKSRARTLHAKITAVMPRPRIQIDPAVAGALVAAAAQQQQQQQHATNQQPEPSPANRPRHDRQPEPIVHRTVAAPPTYVLRGETMGGAKICTKWTSMDECNADCTRQIRAGTMAALSKDAGLTKSCVCVEGKGC